MEQGPGVAAGAVGWAQRTGAGPQPAHCECVCVCETHAQSVPGCLLMLLPRRQFPGHGRLFLPEAGLFTSQAASPVCAHRSSGLLRTLACVHTHKAHGFSP